MKKVILMCFLAMFSISLLSQTVKNERYTKKYFIDEKGDQVTAMSFAGFPPKELPMPNTELPKVMAKDGEKGFFALNNVPAYTWSYGAMPTSAAIMSAYYDNFGAPTVYTGAANGGVAPQTNVVWNSQSSQPDTDQCPLAASKLGVDGRATKGHGDDYWVEYLNETDPYYGNWTEHTSNVGQPCTADYMGSNQWYNWENADGYTYIWASVSGTLPYGEPPFPLLGEGIHGLRLFYESLGLTVDYNYSRIITGYNDPDDFPDLGPAAGGYEFSMYKASIDAGRPVLIQLEGHTLVGFGYDDTVTPATIYVRDCWDNSTGQTSHSMLWGGKYYTMQMYAVSEIVLGTECYYAAPTNIFALNNNRSVTVSWADPSKGTKSMRYIVYRDGTQIATNISSTSYVDAAAADGTHYWSVKAYYVANSFTSYMSKTASAYVSASVTSFSDDFERTVITDKWLFNPATAYWGRDTAVKYAGLASLSDSPGTNYTDATDQLPLGGSVAEIAPGLNFVTAADATCTFWLTYNIEESFDYLHFQACKDGVNWVTLKTWSSEVLGDAWALETIKLGMFAGEWNVRFRFILVTDQTTNSAGSNIDNFAITPSTVDSSAPYVYYTKDKDYYTEKADGFEITATITDFTGINYARVYYKVNGGTEVYANPSSAYGSTYFWKLPVQAPGSLVEFRFETKDTAPTPNTGSKGPFYYRDGLQQKYDSGEVSLYNEIVTTTAQNDTKAVANKFTSFHDDIAGAIIRGYDAASLPDNAQMLINVWADNAGLPGAAMITPLAFTNPATLSETNAWGYVDLSSYTALDDMAGDYYIGFECGVNPATGVTRTTLTDTGEENEYDFGRAYYQYYTLNGSGLVWAQSTGYNFHIRCVTTNNEIIPGIIDPSPNVLSEMITAGGTSSSTLNVNNVGGYPLDYTASIDYDGYASSAVVHENNFDTVLGWTASGSPPFSRVTTWDGGSLNGTGFAKNSSVTYGTLNTGYLTSPVQNLSSYAAATISWLQKTIFSSSNRGLLQVSNDGITWTTLYTVNTNTGEWSNGAEIECEIPSQFLTTTVRFRFTGIIATKSGNYIAIDNVVITGFNSYSWLTLDGGATTSGTVAVSSSDPITVGFNTVGLGGGQYTANIRLNSQYSNESVPVQLTVFSLTLPYAPTLLSPTSGQNLTDFTPYFDWTDATYATAYNIMIDNNSDYSSPEVNTEVSASNYQQTTNLASGIYYWKVRSKNIMGYSSFTGSWTVNILLGIPVPIVLPPNTIDWADVEGATSYNIFSSPDPYGTFTFLTNVTVSQYTYSTADQRMFFYIAAVSGSKEQPKTIEIPKKVK